MKYCTAKTVHFQFWISSLLNMNVTTLHLLIWRICINVTVHWGLWASPSNNTTRLKSYSTFSHWALTYLRLFCKIAVKAFHISLIWMKVVNFTLTIITYSLTLNLTAPFFLPYLPIPEHARRMLTCLFILFCHSDTECVLLKWLTMVL